MHLGSTSTCMNYFKPIPFDLIFWSSPWSERKIWLNFKATFISKAGEAMPTNVGSHAFRINLYLHEFFDLYMCNSNFWPLWTISPLFKRENWLNLKANFISKTSKATPTKISVNTYQHLFEWIFWADSIWFYFFTPMDYTMVWKGNEMKALIRRHIMKD